MAGRLADIRFRVVRVGDPAAGDEWSTGPDGSFTWMVMSAVWRLVTDATVANRVAGIEVTDQTTVWFRSAAGTNQAASTTTDYTAFGGAGFQAANGAIQHVPVPARGLVVPRGNLVRSVTQAIVAGDQISAVALHVIEYETGRIAPGLPIPEPYVEAFDPTFVG